MSNVVSIRPELPRTLTRQEAGDLVRDVIADSGNIVWTSHARQRMEQRDVTDLQVLRVLKRGTVVADPVFGNDRNWEVTFEDISAGETIRVAVAIDVDRMGHVLVIVTVMVV